MEQRFVSQTEGGGTFANCRLLCRSEPWAQGTAALEGLYPKHKAHSFLFFIPTAAPEVAQWGIARDFNYEQSCLVLELVSRCDKEQRRLWKKQDCKSASSSSPTGEISKKSNWLLMNREYDRLTRWSLCSCYSVWGYRDFLRTPSRTKRIG